MGHSVFGGMQRLNIEAARRQAGQDLLQTPNPGLPPSTGTGTPISLSTPDILNSLINITNPFFESSLADDTDLLSQQDYEEPEKKVFANLETPVTTSSGGYAISGNPSQSLITTSTNVSTSNANNFVGSPLSITSTSTSTLSDAGVSSPPPQQLTPQPQTSVESMRSKLIKDSLKLTIQTKRKNSGKEELDVKSELVSKRPKREEVVTYDFSISNDSIEESLPPTKLTPEDEERRRRRRERNKVAATKCRNKKKEKTVLLVQEAEILESDNITMKSEIAQMEEEFRRLTALLESHAPSCLLDPQNNEHKPSTSSSQQHHQQPHNNEDLGGNGHSNLMSSMDTSSYTASVHHDYNQEMDPHLAISPHHNHNHNHFMGSNMNNMNYFGPMHHQTIQLS